MLQVGITFSFAFDGWSMRNLHQACLWKRHSRKRFLGLVKTSAIFAICILSISEICQAWNFNVMCKMPFRFWASSLAVNMPSIKLKEAFIFSGKLVRKSRIQISLQRKIVQTRLCLLPACTCESVFIAAQDSSIGDIVTHSLTQSVSQSVSQSDFWFILLKLLKSKHWRRDQLGPV